MEEIEFQHFPKIARLSRKMVITEKIDGTNAQILITDDGAIRAGSRNRFLSLDSDNYGFAKWVEGNKEELLKLGPGRHFGEWWGQGIQRNYGLKEKRFSLFNHKRWGVERPACCHVVPFLFEGLFESEYINQVFWALRERGSCAAPGFGNPEGIVVLHAASNTLYKKTYEKDEAGKEAE